MGTFAQGLYVSQQQKLSQQMKLSPQQLQSLRILELNNLELRDSIYEEIEKNPFLEIVKDARAENESLSKIQKSNYDNIRLKDKSLINEEKSDNFQAFLENQPEKTESLQDHLLSQYRIMVKNQIELDLGTKIIYNLDERGFHRISPYSLLDSDKPEETEFLLEKCLKTVQKLDPVGCAVSNPIESLLVQAQFDKNAPVLAIYILKDETLFSEIAKPAELLKHLQKIKKQDLNSEILPDVSVTENTVLEAINFIKTLTPFPAQDFFSETEQYIMPEILVSKVQNTEEMEISKDTLQFEIKFLSDLLPEVVLSPMYEDFENIVQVKGQKLTEEQKQQKKFVQNSIRDAQAFLNNLKERENTLIKVVSAIVHEQREFFAKGPYYLVPLRMKDIAEKVELSESTISRLAQGKYLQCEWGIFEIRYFFSSRVNTNESSSNSTERSKESVKQELKQIIVQHMTENPTAKPLSDQKLSDLLAQRGVQIARRTVAKYRAELKIDSSFER